MYLTPEPTAGLDNRPGFVRATTLSQDIINEAVLIERCKSGDADAWDKLIRRYRKPVYNIAYSFCHNWEDTAEIAGQVFMRLYQNIHTFRSESSFTTWLFRIVRNTYLDLCVRPMHRSHLSLDARPSSYDNPAQMRDIVDPAPSADTICIRNEQALLLAQAIRHLPACQRQVLNLCHADGKSYAEIAKSTGVPVGTVKSRLNRARTMLRERLEPYQEMLTVA